MGLEALNSANYMPFIERSLASDAFTPHRHLGVAVRTNGEDWSAKVGVFSTSSRRYVLEPVRADAPGSARLAAFPGVATGGGQYVDVIGRVTWAPVHTDEALIHIGGSGRFHKPNSSTGTATVGGTSSGGNDNRVMLLGLNTTNSEANVLRENLLGTPDLSCGPISFRRRAGTQPVAGHCVSSVVSYGAELAASYGPFASRASISAPITPATAARSPSPAGRRAVPASIRSAAPRSNFNGFYVSGMWFLTGESRAATYNIQRL